VTKPEVTKLEVQAAAVGAPEEAPETVEAVHAERVQVQVAGEEAAAVP
jgi:hypothetical protein